MMCYPSWYWKWNISGELGQYHGTLIWKQMIELENIIHVSWNKFKTPRLIFIILRTPTAETAAHIGQNSMDGYSFQYHCEHFVKIQHNYMYFNYYTNFTGTVFQLSKVGWKDSIKVKRARSSLIQLRKHIKRRNNDFEKTLNNATQNLFTL